MPSRFFAASELAPLDIISILHRNSDIHSLCSGILPRVREHLEPHKSTYSRAVQYVQERMQRSRIVLLLAGFFSLPSLACAQSDQAELFGGYSLERIAPGCGSNYRCGSPTPGPATDMSGWITSLTGFVYKSIGISAQFAGNYNGTAALSYSSVPIDTVTSSGLPTKCAGIARALLRMLCSAVSHSKIVARSNS